MWFEIFEWHRWSCGGLAVLILFCPKGVMAAQAERTVPAQPHKPAWQWSVTERLSERFDPSSQKARAAAHVAEQEAVLQRFPMAGIEGGEPGSQEIETDTIDGDRTPELFLVWELFDTLLSSSFSPEMSYRHDSRRAIESRAAALGFGSNVWKRLEKVADPYLTLQRNDFRRATAPPIATTEHGGKKASDAILWCRTRAKAITAAKKEFGEELFMRLLYEAVAPTASRTYVIQEGLAKHLRYVEGGCQ